MQKLKDVRTLTTTALLIAIGIVLGLFKIPLTETIQIYFTSIPVALSGFLFGPAIGFITGILVDLGSFIVRPTGPFFPGFTLTAGLNGLLYGMLLYKKQGTVKEIGIAQVAVSLISSWIANSCNLFVMLHTPLAVLLVSRLPKEIIMTPIHGLMVYLGIQAVSQIRKRKK